MNYNRQDTFNNILKSSKRTFRVSDEYRTNPLSVKPGGSIIKVIYKDGSIRIYDKIKNVEAYKRFLWNSSKNEIEDVTEMD